MLSCRGCVTCYALFLIPVHGFAETACSMVSNLVGQGLTARIGGLLGRSVAAGYGVVVPLLGLTLLFPETVLSVFTSDRHLVAASVDSLRVIVLAVLLVVPAVSACVLGLAYLFMLQLAWPLATVWFAEIAGLALCLALSWARLRSGRWQGARV